MKLEQSSREGMTLIEALLVLAILAVLTGLSLPAILRARATADRLQCANNIRQIGLALSNYHAAQGQLPSGSRDAPDPFPYLTWLGRILPYVEQDALWRQATT